MIDSEAYKRITSTMESYIFDRLAISQYDSNRNDISSANNRLCTNLAGGLRQLISILYPTIDYPVNPSDFSFTFDVVDSSGTEDFSGIRIYPSISVAEDIAKEMVLNRAKSDTLYELWRKCIHWSVDIDERLFDSQYISARPDEIVVMLINTWGNTYHDAVPLERYIEACKEWFYVSSGLDENPTPDPSSSSVRSLSVQMKTQLKSTYQLFTIPLWVSCKYSDILKESATLDPHYSASSKWSIAPSSLLYTITNSSTEDNKLVDIYIKFVAKLIHNFGTSFDKGEDYSVDQVKSYVRWAVQYGVDKNHRKLHLHDNLLMLAKTSAGQYGKALAVKILNDFGVGLRDRFSGAILESAQMEEIIMESTNDLYEKYAPEDLSKYGKSSKVSAMESLVRTTKSKARSNKDMLLPSDYEIDSIGVEIDRINSHHDRVYVLDLIYKAIDDIEQIINYYDLAHSSKSSRVKSKGESQLKRLYHYRDMVMDKKNFNHDYRIFVKVPPGYEG